MKNSNDLILELIKNNASVNQICEITGLTHKQLFYRMNMLKLKGYDFTKKYYYSGDISYKLIKNFHEEEVNTKTIYTSNKDTEFKALLISDLHLGSIDERPELLDEVYNYATKEGINIIINAGDLIDGSFGRKSKKIDSVNKQIEYLLKNYPFDKNILNFICLGNHDLSSLEKEGLDLSKILDNKRHDLISLGYAQGNIKIKNDRITVYHPSTNCNKTYEAIDKGLIITGHTHRTKFIVNGNKVDLQLPTLSDMNNNIHYPSIMKLTIDFHNGIFNIGLFEHLLFIGNKLYKVSESEYELFKGKDNNKKIINNEDEVKELDVSKIIKTNNYEEKNKDNIEKKLRLSQTDKFYKRYNIEKK